MPVSRQEERKENEKRKKEICFSEGLNRSLKIIPSSLDPQFGPRRTSQLTHARTLLVAEGEPIGKD